MTVKRKFMVGLFSVFMAFGAVTTAYPCKTSYPVVKHAIQKMLFPTLHAQTTISGKEFHGAEGANVTIITPVNPGHEGHKGHSDMSEPWDCSCNRGSSNSGCEECGYESFGSWMGCGPAWFYSCDGYGVDHGIFGE